MNRRDIFEAITGERIKGRKDHPMIGCLVTLSLFLFVISVLGVLGALAF